MCALVTEFRLVLFRSPLRREEIADGGPTKGLSACASGEPLVRPHRRWRVLGLLRTRTSHHGFAHMPRGGDQEQNRITSPPCLVERILPDGPARSRQRDRAASRHPYDRSSARTKDRKSAV